jgi:hypothetical protein
MPMTDQLEMVFAARDEGLARVTDASSEWDRRLVQQVILAQIETLGEASANDVRELIDIERRNLIGAVFNSLRMRKIITPVREVRSTDIGTHGKKISVYRMVS